MLFQPPDLDRALLRDLTDDVLEHYRSCEEMLLNLERTPSDNDTINRLFRAVHTIKGNLGITGISPPQPLLTAAEDLIGKVRAGDMPFSDSLGDLLLVILDKVVAFLEDVVNQGEASLDPGITGALSDAVTRICAATTPGVDHSAELNRALALLDPSLAISDAPLATESTQPTVFADLDLTGNTDLLFFRTLMEPIEQRSEYWRGRNDRLLKMALILNQLADNPVNREQLAAAVYVHDFGMAFMPLDLLHSPDTLNDNQIILLRSHVQLSAQLLQNMPQWSKAREMIMQHHEAVDGSGYPYGLRGKQICDGAKIIAIADTFDALTHQRAQQGHVKRPVIRAVKEINDCAGRQLCREWVAIFNRAVQPILLAHHTRKLKT